MISQVQQNSGIFINVMPGARMFRIVVMMLIEPMIEDMPRMWTAKIVRSMLMPCWTVSGGYRVQPTPGAAAGDEQREQEQQRRRRQQPEAPVVQPREGHVGRADLHRDQPVREADERRHDRAEHHDQAV